MLDQQWDDKLRNDAAETLSKSALLLEEARDLVPIYQRTVRENDLGSLVTARTKMLDLSSRILEVVYQADMIMAAAMARTVEQRNTHDLERQKISRFGVRLIREIEHRLAEG